MLGMQAAFIIMGALGCHSQAPGGQPEATVVKIYIQGKHSAGMHMVGIKDTSTTKTNSVTFWVVCFSLEFLFLAMVGLWSMAQQALALGHFAMLSAGQTWWLTITMAGLSIAAK